MSNTKRSWFALGLILMLTAALVGCSAQSSAAPSSSAPAVSSAPTAPSASSAAPSAQAPAPAPSQSKTVKTASGEEWPTGPIELIISGSPGGGTDIPARLVATYLEKELGVSIMPVNMDAGGAISAYNYVGSTAAPDGYTLGYCSAPTWQVNFVEGTLLTDPRTDYAYIGQVVFNPQTISVNKDSPFHTFEELTEYAKAHPDELIYADTGVTGLKSLLAQWMGTEYGIHFRQISHGGDKDSIVALMGGHVDVAMNATSAIIPYVESGDLRPLAISTGTTERYSLLPDVPTFMELGYEPPIAGSSHILVVRSATDPAIVARLREAYDAMMKNPEFLAQAKKSSLEVTYANAAKLKEEEAELFPFLEEFLAMIKS
jgi:tripartite-type tricarboxylate transporter receptor subunit TctC